MKIRLTTAPRDMQALRVSAIPVVVRTRPERILDFDVEARPLHWIAADYVSKEITAIAWAWVHRPDHVEWRLLGEDNSDTLLDDFLVAYNQADVVTGHYIRGYDLPMVNGALIERRLPPLADKFAHDTKLDLIRQSGLSLSQENLGALLHLEHEKVQMNQERWRQANRLAPEGIAFTRERVMGDVKQHIELRRELLSLGYLAGPKVWKSGSTKLEGYTP